MTQWNQKPISETINKKRDINKDVLGKRILHWYY